MNGMPSAAVISFSRPAISWVSACALDDAGTGDQEQRPSRPDFMSAQPHDSLRLRAAPTARLMRPPPAAAAARCARAARMKPVNSGWPSRGVEVNSGWNWRGDEPRVLRQLDHLHQAVAREAGEAQPRLAVALQIVVVELVAVAMALA